MLWLKIITVPLLVGLVSLAGRKWGPLVSGWLVGLPLTSGPVVLFLALEQGRSFAATSAQGTMIGLISVCVFCLIYSRLARRFGWPFSLFCSILVFLICTDLLNHLHISLPLSFFLVLLALGLTLLLLDKSTGETGTDEVPGWEIFLRMVAATGLVVIITEAAHILGPYLSGLLTPFPIFTSVFAVFTHRSKGGVAATRLLRGVIAGLFTFATFFFLVASLIMRFGTASAFVCAVCSAILLHAGSLWLLHR